MLLENYHLIFEIAIWFATVPIQIEILKTSIHNHQIRLQNPAHDPYPSFPIASTGQQLIASSHSVFSS